VVSNENKAELFLAISKMQSELTGAYKAKAGHGYNYADLAQCIKTAQAPLANNGLAVIQLLNETENGTELETVLTHESGGFISSSFLMAKASLAGGGANNPAQLMGASITYSRRYAYAAIIGMAQTDDDASQYDELIDLVLDKGYTINQLLGTFEPKLTKITQIKDVKTTFDNVSKWAQQTKPTEQK
jgi:hypothetical protein